MSTENDINYDGDICCTIMSEAVHEAQCKIAKEESFEDLVARHRPDAYDDKQREREYLKKVDELSAKIFDQKVSELDSETRVEFEKCFEATMRKSEMYSLTEDFDEVALESDDSGEGAEKKEEKENVKTQ